MTALKKLKELEHLAKIAKYPGFPADYLGSTNYTPKTANGLTRCVIDWIKYNGGQAEKINNTGRYIDSSEIVTDVLGHKRKIGSGKYIPGTGTNGTADISSTIPVKINGQNVGLSVKWEIKINKDRQSDSQKDYEKAINSAGGYYFIVHTLDEFVKIYENLINKFV